MLLLLLLLLFLLQPIDCFSSHRLPSRGSSFLWHRVVLFTAFFSMFDVDSISDSEFFLLLLLFLLQPIDCFSSHRLPSRGSSFLWHRVVLFTAFFSMFDADSMLCFCKRPTDNRSTSIGFRFRNDTKPGRRLRRRRRHRRRRGSLDQRGWPDDLPPPTTSRCRPFDFCCFFFIIFVSFLSNLRLRQTHTHTHTHTLFHSVA